ncbi:MerR family transcriptional regulator [Bacillus infantis]|uniref:MerR family transcriptional regulator n=1 Tax=Bacillus infantis TaxID=324767 RepID=UPI003CEC53A4
METQFMKAYTIKEVSKKIGVPSGTLRQWEKDLNGLLVIPRSKQGVRFFTDTEIELLGKIKEMREKNLSKEMIRHLMQIHLDGRGEEDAGTLPASPPAVTRSLEANPVNDMELFMEALDSYKESFLADIRSEIRNGIRKEVLEEVKKEISRGSVHTVKTISDSIYKTAEGTKSQLKSLSHKIEQVSEDTSETFGAFSEEVARASEGTSEQIRQLTSRVSDSSEAASEEFKTMIHYISKSAEITNHEITSLIDTLNKDRDAYLHAMNEEREQYRVDIKQREDIFQDFVVGFRQAAAAEEKAKKGWKFWK